MQSKISAEIVAHSTNEFGDELISVLATFPRIILAEVNTHRMLSKNTSSSRAIPFNKMVEIIKTNPFIPIAWQKEHSGMQGSEYLSSTEEYGIFDFMMSLNSTLNTFEKGSKEYRETEKKINGLVALLDGVSNEYRFTKKTLNDWWLLARDKAVETAVLIHVLGVTKQLANRILEPFMWTTMLITGSKEGWENFFKLRCPSYDLPITPSKVYKSKKEAIKNHNYPELNTLKDIFWLEHNKGQAEIHMMALAESIYDAVNESTPKQLKAGEWHIPFINRFDSYSTLNTDASAIDLRKDFDMNDIKISVAMAARTSYTVVGEEKKIDYQKMIDLHDRLLSQDPPHSSPLEHCAKSMNNAEYESFYKGQIGLGGESGWCNNFKGFIPYRYLVDNKLTL